MFEGRRCLLEGLRRSFFPSVLQLGLAPNVSVKIRDLWQQKDLGTFSGNWTTKALQPHDVQMLKLFVSTGSTEGH